MILMEKIHSRMADGHWPGLNHANVFFHPDYDRVAQLERTVMD